MKIGNTRIHHQLKQKIFFNNNYSNVPKRLHKNTTSNRYPILLGMYTLMFTVYYLWYRRTTVVCMIVGIKIKFENKNIWNKSCVSLRIISKFLYIYSYIYIGYRNYLTVVWCGWWLVFQY
jgi:hypothetical protein